MRRSRRRKRAGVDLIKGEAQLVFDKRGREREISAVDIVDEDREREEDARRVSRGRGATWPR